MDMSNDLSAYIAEQKFPFLEQNLFLVTQRFYSFSYIMATLRMRALAQNPSLDRLRKYGFRINMAQLLYCMHNIFFLFPVNFHLFIEILFH